MRTVEPHVGTAAATEMPASLDTRTLQILEQRRTSAVRMRRGWLVRRMLVIADLVGLTVASSHPRSSSARARPPTQSARRWSCSSSPEPARLGHRRKALRPVRLRRGAHRPLDRGRPRRRLAPGHGRQLALLRFATVTGSADPGVARLLGFWLFAIVAGHASAGRSRAAWPGAISPTSRTRSSSAPATSGSWSRRSSPAPRVRAQPRRLRRRRSPKTAPRASNDVALLGGLRAAAADRPDPRTSSGSSSPSRTTRTRRCST